MASGLRVPGARWASARGVLAAAPAVATILVAWASLEDPPSWPAFAVAAALALTPGLVVRDVGRAIVAGAASVSALSLVFRTWPEHALGSVWSALHAAPAVQAPFDPDGFPELHGLVAMAGFGLALAATLGVAYRRVPVVVAAIAVGVGFPATLLDDAHALLLGTLALGSVLWASAVLRARTARRALPGAALAATVVVTAAAMASVGVAPGQTHVDWRGWDPFARGGGTTDLSFVWEANYAGIAFPARPTVVLQVRAPRQAEYWRVSTLETFDADRWIENLYPAGSAYPVTSRGGATLPPDPLVPQRDRRPADWLWQEVTVTALEDDHVVAASEPAHIDGPSLGRLSFMSGGVIRANAPTTSGTKYTVASYTPRPSPRDLARSPARYPAATSRYLELGRAQFPAFGTPGRDRRIARLFTDVRYEPLWPYRGVLQDARKVTERARSPYEATLLLERWFRGAGGFVYDEQPPRTGANPPLVDFVERTRAGYCQHFAGAMAVMLRMLGVPARVAVGFTAGSWKDGVWTVTDYDAHAWVEAWFAGYGWLPFDPTPGRGTLSATYTLASDSADAVAALGTGRFLDFDEDFTAAPSPETAPPAAVADVEKHGVAWWLVAVPILPLIAGVLVILVKSTRRAYRLRRRDPRMLAFGVRAELVDAVLDRGVELDAHASTRVLTRTAERALATPCGTLTAALAEARYGPAPRAGGAAARARNELRHVLAVARSREQPAGRLRSMLSLRSLLRGLTASAR